MKALVSILIDIAMFMSLAVAQAPSRMSAQEIMDRVFSTYATCRSYADDGQTVMTAHGRQLGLRYFSTLFVSPSKFRFEVNFDQGKEQQRFVVWKDGAREESWGTLREPAVGATLDRALASYERPSLGASVAIPGLLLPSLFTAGSALTTLTDLKLTGEENLDSRATFRIEGKSSGGKVKLWIDQREFLILKVYRRETPWTPPGMTLDVQLEFTTNYKPRLNVDIPSDRLASDPATSNISPPISGPSKLEIIKLSWSREYRGAYMRPAESKSPSAPPDAPVPDPSGPFPPGGRLRTVYVYQLKIRNRGKTAIRAVSWDYIVNDASTNAELARTHFRARLNLKPDGVETLNGELPSPPSKVINVNSSPNDPAPPEHSEIRCVLYADGAWWQAPGAAKGECDAFIRSSTWGRR